MNIPDFYSPVPAIDVMGSLQKKFYNDLKKSLKNGRYPPVDGNISYLFAYLFELMNDLDNLGYQELYNRLVALSVPYQNEAKFVLGCKNWGFDCLLLLGEHEKFLEVSDIDNPKDIFKKCVHWSDLRCSVAYHACKPASAVDLFRMSPIRVGQNVKQSPERFRRVLEDVFEEYAEREGPWLERRMSLPPPPRKYLKRAFGGTRFSYDHVSIEGYCFYDSEEFLKMISKAGREAAKKMRK